MITIGNFLTLFEAPVARYLRTLLVHDAPQIYKKLMFVPNTIDRNMTNSQLAQNGGMMPPFATLNGLISQNICSI